MNKADLIDKIAKDANLTKVQANAMLDSFTSAVINALKKGDSVILTGFGSFSVSDRAARNSRNPQTGAVIKIKARKSPKFKASKQFAESISDGMRSARRRDGGPEDGGTDDTGPMRTKK